MPPRGPRDPSEDDAEEHLEATVVAGDPTTVATLPETPELGAKTGGDPYLGSIISDRYRVLRKLGEGGMGTVYLAEHVVIEKKVAIKVLSDDFARKADLVQRFMQEAKAASRIGHENIVDVTDFGQTQAGSVFIAMEYLEGSDLATVIREQGPLPTARVRSITHQICRALGAAHGKGIIHRDMKPENIFLVERDGRTDFVKILDFGIAKMSATDEQNERLTRTGMIFGTPEYMSPEQARGERPDHRVDVYAAGCIAYEMLCGDVPFHAETFMGVLTKHLFETPELPSVRAPEAQVPPDLEAVVMRALAKNRDERYQSMREFSLAIATSDGGDPSTAWGQEGSGQYRPSSLPVVSAQPLSPAPSSPVTVPNIDASPRRGGRGWLGLVLFALGAGGAGYWYFGMRAPTGGAPTALVAPSATGTPTAPVESPAPTVAPNPVVAAPVAPPAVVEHVLTVKSNIPGPGGELFNRAERLGSLPGSFRLEHSDKPIVLTATRKGYKDYALEVRPDRDRQYLARFEPLPRKPVGPPPRRPPPRVEAPVRPAAEAASKPAPKAEPKKTRDLMDPFPSP